MTADLIDGIFAAFGVVMIAAAIITWIVMIFYYRRLAK